MNEDTVFMDMMQPPIIRLHYSFALLRWIRGKLTCAEFDFYGNVVSMSHGIETIGDGSYLSTININGTEHEIIVRPKREIHAKR